MDLSCYTHSLAWMCLLTCVVNWFLAFRMGQFGQRSPVILWFRIFLILGGAIYLAQGIAGCTTVPEVFHIFMGAYGLCTALLTPSLIVFAVYFTNKDYIAQRLWFILGLGLLSSSLLWMFWNGYAMLIDFDKAAISWGFRFEQSGPLSQAAGGLILVGFIIPIAMMFKHLRQQADPAKRAETRLVIWALLVGIIPALTTDVIVRIFLHGPAILSGPVVTVLTAVIIYRALIKYGLHIFNPNTITGNIMEIIPAGLIITDHANSIQYASVGAQEMLGYQRSQMVGLTLQKLLKNPAAYRTFEHDVLHSLDDGRNVLGREVSLHTRDGQDLPVSLNATAITTGHELTNRLIAFTDITHLKAAQEELAQEKASVDQKIVERTRQLQEVQAELEASVGSLPFGFAIVNLDDEIKFANDKLGKLLGYTIPAGAADSRDALHDIDAKFEDSLDILTCLHSAHERIRPLVKNIEVGPRFYRFSFIPVRRGQTNIGTVWLVEDTTEEKATLRSRDEFFSIASHELRTPLTAIRGNTQLIQQYYHEQLKDPDLKQMVGDIYSASVRLIDIVNDFLDVSRLEQNRMVFKIETIDAATLIQDALREYDVTSSRRKLSVQLLPVDGPMLVQADRDRFRQIFINLISNAIKYTPAGGIEVKLTRQDKKIIISVTDTGQGIPEESQHLLFHKFQQASNNILTRDNTRSTGLGLYISSLMAKGMKGSLYLAHTEVGKGSTFTLELPAGE